MSALLMFLASLCFRNVIRQARSIVSDAVVNLGASVSTDKKTLWIGEFQSAHRAGHSTETALLEVTNDVDTFTCDRLTTVILSLDISAAFDTISHSSQHTSWSRLWRFRHRCYRFQLTGCSLLFLFGSNTSP